MHCIISNLPVAAWHLWTGIIGSIYHYDMNGTISERKTINRSIAWNFKQSLSFSGPKICATNLKASKRSPVRFLLQKFRYLERCVLPSILGPSHLPCKFRHSVFDFQASPPFIAEFLTRKSENRHSTTRLHLNLLLSGSPVAPGLRFRSNGARAKWPTGGWRYLRRAPANVEESKKSQTDGYSL